ncbi:MAG: hypothetical protein HY235_04020, partial [Acidobacteria bacterium]|nr:hypothetical protein [Acidobacteriota bacterium]
MHAQLISALISVVFAADTGRQLAARWARPPVEASTAPLYVWNGEMSETAIDRYLTANAAQGVQAAFIHPRPGLITPYLSGRWFSLVRHTVAQGKQRGMHVWLYDENSYPSGFAGGHVPAEMPESWNQGAGLRMKKLATLDPQEERRFVHVIRGAGGVYAFEPVFYEKRAWHGGYSYVDLLKPGVTEKFIELTMGGYEAAIGHEFGHTVPGIFTDEPNIFPPSRDSMRWTPDLFARFEKLKGYDLRPYLTALWEETGDWRKVRHDYWSVLLALFLERWSKPWFQYTEKKGLIWTGHYWEHEWPNPHHVPDNMAVYAWHQMPGIDLLFNQWREDTHAQFGNVRSVREVASVAHQLGRRRVFCETYGGGGWELRFEDMKRLGDWMFGLGINFLNQHLAFHTIAGARKHDYPQSFSYHEPWWDHYRKVADYQARLSLALSSGEVRNRILVIEPTTSAWMYASLPGSGHPRLAEIGREFQDFLNSMEAAQVEYDLASEDILRRYGKVSGSRLMVGHRAYDVLVLPPGLESLEQPTAELLERYRGSGGELAGFVDAVERVDGVASARLAGLKWRRLRSVNEGVFREPDFSLSPRGKVFHQRRRLGDGQLVFLVNSSL